MALPMVLDQNPYHDDALIQRLQYDLATGMHQPDEIARRYGLKDKNELRNYLRQHPMLVEEARKIKALFNSAEGTETRVRAKFQRATEELIVPIAHVVRDPLTPVGARIDGFRQLQRGAGLDGAPAAIRGNESRQTGTAFNLTINFAGGRQEVISGTTVIDASEIPPPPGSLAEHLPTDERALVGRLMSPTTGSGSTIAREAMGEEDYPEEEV